MLESAVPVPIVLSPAAGTGSASLDRGQRKVSSAALQRTKGQRHPTAAATAGRTAQARRCRLIVRVLPTAAVTPEAARCQAIGPALATAVAVDTGRAARTMEAVLTTEAAVSTAVAVVSMAAVVASMAVAVPTAVATVKSI